MAFIVELKGEKIIKNLRYKFIVSYHDYTIFPIKNSFLKNYWKNLKEFGWYIKGEYKKADCLIDFSKYDDCPIFNFGMTESTIPCLTFEFETEEEAFYFKMKHC